jgi:transposase-like protein
LNLPRVPEEFAGIQVNHCRTPGCSNFGVPASTQPVALGRPRSDGIGIRDRYQIDITGKRVPVIACQECGIKAVIKSNQGVREEIDRASAYLRPPPSPSCRSSRCANRGKSVADHPELYHGHGGARWKCKGCGRTCSPGRTRIPPSSGLKRYKNAVILRSALGKMPVRRLLEALAISATTFYQRLEFFEAQFLAFAASRERRLKDLPIDRLYLSSDQQFYMVNWREKGDKRAIHLRAIGTADNQSRYVFAMNLNYDPDARPEIVELEHLLRRDDKKPPPFRRHARLWIESDYELAARRRVPPPVGDMRLQILQNYDELQRREDIDPAMEMSNLLRLPHRGMQVHNEYTIFGHFHHLREMLAHVGKTRWHVDQDSGIRGAVMTAFRDEIKQGRCDVFFLQVDRNKTERQRLTAINAGRLLLEEMASRPGNATKDETELRRLVVKEALGKMEDLGPWKDRWLKHPVPSKGEPEKWICHLTGPLGFYAGDDDHLAALYDLATATGIDQFFMQIRRRFSLLERMLNRAGKGERVWNIYSPYNPAVIQRMLNIYRVFYNFSKRGDDKKTPAMRLGLASGPVDIVRIINYRPETISAGAG